MLPHEECRKKRKHNKTKLTPSQSQFVVDEVKDFFAGVSYYV